MPVGVVLPVLPPMVEMQPTKMSALAFCSKVVLVVARAADDAAGSVIPA